MTTYPAVSVPRPSDSHLAHRTYHQRWQSVPRDLGLLLPSLPIALVVFTVTLTLFLTGLSLAIVWVGVPIAFAALYCARAFGEFGEFELYRLDVARQAPVARPIWPISHQVEESAWRASSQLRTGFTSAVYWRYLFHATIVGFSVSFTSWCVAIVWTVSGVGGLTHWFWSRFLPTDDDQLWLHSIILDFVVPTYTPGSTYQSLDAAESAMYAVFGLALVVTLPWVTNGLLAMHRGAALLLLSTTKSEALARENTELAASRGAAVIAEDHSLRRLERDIHDGPQQRLIRLQYAISSAERKLEADPDGARALLAGALQQSGDALDELRSLSRGFAPPILQDRGLVPAVESLASRSSVPVAVSVTLNESFGLSAIERSAYFVVAELLANIDKHSGASVASVTLASESGLHGTPMLEITVSDNGTGGATATVEQGLAGLRERVLGLRGSLNIDSPAGGPTIVTARIPVDELDSGPSAPTLP
jgi:signal transduction histidine kinase